MNRLPTDYTYTRWRHIDNPVDASDPITDGLSQLKEGKLPHGFVIMVSDDDGSMIEGPFRFPVEAAAEKYLSENEWVKKYLILPRPNE